jgi:hypothetical protein
MTLPTLLAAICLFGLLVIAVANAWCSFIEALERDNPPEGPWSKPPRRVRVSQDRVRDL